MKKLLASVGVLAFAAGAGAQDTPPGLHGTVGDYTDGTNETNYKVAAPSGPSDWWNSFKSTDISGVPLDALAANFVETAGTPGTHAAFGIYDDLGAGVPDTGSAIVELTNLGVPASKAINDDSFYSIPLVTLSASESVHIAARYTTGDSHTWMSSDTSSFNGRTFFTTDSYATGAIPFSINIDLYAGTPHAGNPGDLLMNGSTSATVTNLGNVCTEFFGPTTNTQFILYFCVGGNPFIQLLPLVFTKTDDIFGGSTPGSWGLCADLDCNTPTGSGLEFCTIYEDQLDTKLNGKGKLKVGASAFLTITDDPACAATFCFGQKDDCTLDGNVWKVQNPAGASDWFNVNHGAPTSGVTTLTSASLGAYDFCSIGPCWAEVGIYPSNITLDPTGQTPDVSNPLSNVVGGSACMAVAASGGTCATFTLYDGADYVVDSQAANGVHVAAKWGVADTCIWLGSDTDGIDSVCGTPIPSAGTTSLFTTDSYATSAVGSTAANWLMQIDWN